MLSDGRPDCKKGLIMFGTTQSPIRLIDDITGRITEATLYVVKVGVGRFHYTIRANKWFNIMGMTFSDLALKFYQTYGKRIERVQ